MSGRTARLRRFASSPAATVLKVMVSLGILLWFGLRIDYTTLGRFMTEVRPVFLVVLVALSFFRMWISALRFRALSNLYVSIPFRTLVRQYFIAAYFNNFLPTAVGGDAVRLFMLSDCGLPKQEGAVFILTERFIGSAALVLISLVGILLFPVPFQIDVVVGLLAAGTVLAIAIGVAGRGILAEQAERRPGLRRILRALALLSNSPKVLIWVLVTSLLFQLSSIALSWVVALAFGLEIPFSACLALVPLVWLATMVPISIGGIGLREASFTYLFGSVGVPTEASLLISLGTFASLLLNGVVGAVLFFQDSVLASVARRAAQQGDDAE